MSADCSLQPRKMCCNLDCSLGESRGGYQKYADGSVMVVLSIDGGLDLYSIGREAIIRSTLLRSAPIGATGFACSEICIGWLPDARNDEAELGAGRSVSDPRSLSPGGYGESPGGKSGVGDGVLSRGQSSVLAGSEAIESSSTAGVAACHRSPGGQRARGRGLERARIG